MSEEINLAELDNLSSTEIDDLRTKNLEKLQKSQNNEAVVKESILQLQSKILGLQKEKKDLEITAGKASHVVKTLNNNQKVLDSKFWKARNSGV